MKTKKEPNPHKPLTSKEFKAMGPWLRFDELPANERAAIEMIKAMGRPKLERPKEKVTIRLDQDILRAFRAKGKGWQTQLNAKLREMVTAGQI